MSLKDLFTAHPKSVNETYFKHLYFAGKSGFKLMFAGAACVIHAILPFIFIKTASNVVNEIHDHMHSRTELPPTE